MAPPDRRTCQLPPWTTLLPNEYWFSGLRGSSKAKVSSGEDLPLRSGPQTSMCNRAQRAYGKCRSFHLTPTDAKLVGVRWGPGMASNVLISGGADVGGPGTALGEPHLSPPWWASVYHPNLSLWTHLCSSHGVKMGHLINGNHFHPPSPREGDIILFFSFLFLPGLVGRGHQTSHFTFS